MSTTTIASPLMASPSSAQQRGSVRLTRRGRLVVFLLALIAVLAVGVLLASGSVATGERGTAAPTRTVMVGSGDTLWDIAAEIADDGDVRGMVHQISRLNALDSSLVTAGQKLRVPVQ